MDTSVDMIAIMNKFENKLDGISEVVGIWEFTIIGCPINLKIKVVKTSNMSIPPYMGMANYGIKNSTQATPYWSMRPCKTVQDALIDALRGFFTYYKPENAEDTEYKLSEDWM